MKRNTELLLSPHLVHMAEPMSFAQQAAWEKDRRRTPQPAKLPLTLSKLAKTAGEWLIQPDQSECWVRIAKREVRRLLLVHPLILVDVRKDGNHLEIVEHS